MNKANDIVVKQLGIKDEGETNRKGRDRQEVKEKDLEKEIQMVTRAGKEVGRREGKQGGTGGMEEGGIKEEEYGQPKLGE